MLSRRFTPILRPPQRPASHRVRLRVGQRERVMSVTRFDNCYRIGNPPGGLALYPSSGGDPVVMQRANTGAANEIWTLEPQGAGLFRLILPSEGKLLLMTDQGVKALPVSGTITADQQWKLTPNGDQTYRISPQRPSDTGNLYYSTDYGLTTASDATNTPARFRLEAATCPVQLPADCNIRIVAKDAAGQESTTLTRKPGTTGQFLPLTLSVESLDNSPLSGLAYRWATPASGTATTPGPVSLSADQRGEYNLQLAIPGLAQTCEAYVSLSAKPCTERKPTYAGCRSVNVSNPDAANTLPLLQVGDRFNAADYTVTVTEVTDGGAGGWTGTGTLEVTLLNGINVPVSVTFENAKLNDCYELVNGKVLTRYDPNWGNILDVGGIVDIVRDIEDLYKDIQEFLKTYTDTPENKAKLVAYKNQLNALETKVAQNNDVLPATKTFYTGILQSGQASLQCVAPKTLGSVPGNRAARVSGTQEGDCNSDAAKAQIDAQQKQLNSYVWVAEPDTTSNSKSFLDCINNIDYHELNSVPATGPVSVTLVFTRGGKEVGRGTATIRGSFYRIIRNNTEYFYSEKVTSCKAQTVVLIHQYPTNSSAYDGIYSYYDYDSKEYIPFWPKNYPQESVAAMIRRMGPGLSTFAGVTENVFVNTMTFLAGGGPTGSALKIGKVLQGVQWGAFAFEQVAAVYPGWDAKTKELFGKTRWALLAVQVGLSIAEFRQLGKLAKLTKQEQGDVETIAERVNEGEMDDMISKARDYANTLPTDHPFRIYMNRLANRLSARLLGKYATRIDNFVEVVEQDALVGDGARNFLDKVYRTVITKQEVILFRSFGNPEAKINGAYAAIFKGATREELAILTKWKNSMRFEVKIRVPTGTKINIGRAAPQPNPPQLGSENLKGLGEQALLPFKWNLQWVDEIVDKQTGQVYRSVNEFKNKFPELFYQ